MLNVISENGISETGHGKSQWWHFKIDGEVI